MMLTAIPANHSPSVFAHNHNPPGGSSSASLTQSAISPDSSPEGHHHHHQHLQQPQDQRASEGQQQQAFLVGSAGVRTMDNRKVPLPATGQVIHGNPAPVPGAGVASNPVVASAQPPQIIPVQQSFILGTGATAGYILPSITHLSSLPNTEGAMVGIQPLNTLSSVTRPMSIQSTPAATATIQPPTAGSLGYYGQVQSDASRPPLTFQPHISSSSAADVRVVFNASVGASTPSSIFTRTVSSPQQQEQVQQQQQQTLHLSQHHHHLRPTSSNNNMAAINSGLLPPSRTSILNGNLQSSDSTPPPPPPALLPASATSPNMEDTTAGSSVASLRPILSPPQSNRASSGGDNTSSAMSPVCASPSSDSGRCISSNSGVNQKQMDHHLQEHDLEDQHHQQQRGRKRPPSHDLDVASSYTRSRAARQATRFGENSMTSLDSSMLQGGMRIKREPEDGASSVAPPPPTHLLHSVRRNSESNLEEAANSSSKSYQISALIDVPPMVSALNRASRTSSPCSSISSIRFGGSLNQLNCLPPHISIGKIHDMKSTGNLTAEAAVLPSLNNQYFAFGGSLPELSLTSLTRLLPNSSANDPAFPACHLLLTHPMYVYASQQQLATPIINSHGSINFGSFLSNGPNLCTSSKVVGGGGSPGSAGGGNRAGSGSLSDITSGDGRKKDDCVESMVGKTADSTTQDDAEEKIDVGCDSSLAAQSPMAAPPATSANLVQDSVIKMPTVYSPLVTGVAPGVITTLPAFGMLARGSGNADSNAHQVGSSDQSGNGGSSLISNNNNRTPAVPSSPPTTLSLPIANATIDPHPPPLGGHIMHQLHSQQQVAGAAALHPSPHPLILPLQQAHTHLHSVDSTPNCITDKPQQQHMHTISPPTQPDLYLPLGANGRVSERRDGATPVGGAGVRPRGPPLLQQVPMGAGGMSGIKLENDMELDYESSLNIQPIVAHDGGTRGVASSALHSPPGEQQVMDAHMLQGGSTVMVDNTSMAMGAAAMKKEKDKPYKCDHPGCGRTFSFPAHLRSHIQQIHISYRPCKCEFPGCGKRFYTPQHLNVHRRVHTGERPFVCPYADCSKAFTTAGNLKNHIRTHTGERPYACKFEGCSKRFAEMSSLKKHELTHTGEKPYKCRVCGKAFSQAGSRNTHERKHNRSEEEELSGVGGAQGAGGSVIVREGGISAGLKGPKKYRVRRVSGGNASEDSMMQT